MTWYTGSVAPVPQANRDAYRNHLATAWPVMRRHGALRMVESWGVDLPRGKVNDFHVAVEASAEEGIVFAWLEWSDQAAADAAFSAMQKDPAMQEMGEMPFDGSRMIFGGFDPVLSEGSDRNAGYLQGFVLPVPESNKTAYVDLSRQIWEQSFKAQGCLGTVEGWGVDVPHGRKTDFHRAVLAKPGEVPLFSWTAWPDRARCDAAAAAMSDHPDVEMPFDGMRMFWGGFEVIFDSDRDG